MKYIIPLLLISVFLFSCEKDDHPCLPPCLAPIIGDIAEYPCDSTGRIIQYKFMKDMVYYIDPGFCYFDQLYDVIDSDCEVIGQLGGISGISTINDVEFFDNAEFIAVIWEQ